MSGHRAVSVAPRVPTNRELLIIVVAVFYVLLWTVCIVLSIDNVQDRHEGNVTPMTVAPAVTYQEVPADG